MLHNTVFGIPATGFAIGLMVRAVSRTLPRLNACTPILCTASEMLPATACKPSEPVIYKNCHHLFECLPKVQVLAAAAGTKPPGIKLQT